MYSYTFVKSNSSETRFYVVEEWETQGHLDLHFASDHFKRLIPELDAISTTPGFDVCTDCFSHLPSIVPLIAAAPPDPSLAVVSSVSTTTSTVARVGHILVLYDSSSNCTEEMAALVAEGVELVDGMEIRIRSVPGEVNHWDINPVVRETKYPVASFDDVFWADGIACGTPNNLGGVSWRMKKFWDDFSQVVSNCV